MTPTPIDLDALARNWEQRAAGAPDFSGNFAYAHCAQALRAALAQVSPTGEPTLRAKVEALRRPKALSGSRYDFCEDKAWNRAIDAVLALLPATGEPAPTCATCRCGEPIRLIDGQWLDSETWTTCSGGNAPHRPESTVDRYEAALWSIANNSCCAGCQEAKKVAQSALEAHS